MLTLDLARLEREGSLTVAVEVPVDHPLWRGSGLRLRRALRGQLRARVAVSGEIVVRGELEAHLEEECRRCLDPVPVSVERALTLVYGSSDDAEQPVGGEARPLPSTGAALDLSEAVREELILMRERFVVCDPSCRGLCPICGANRNEKNCDCSLEEPDPRWDALRALKNE
jgi:DUF177 domain-containing protein